MRRLMLLRHAKSSWSDADLHDAARPLNARGRLAATLMGAYLREAGMAPDLALVSTAQRAVETWDGVERELAARPARASSPLYMAAPDAMLDVLRGAPDDARAVVMVGHEPGISAFLHRMTGAEIAPGCARAFERFPTASLAELQLDDLAHWRDAEFGAGRFASFVSPKDLV
jgi:phosphohistidine phosphatase